MKRIATALLVYIALFSAAVSVGAATRPKFRSAASSGAADNRYVVTLAEDAAVDDPAALRQELALIYGGKVEINASSEARQFAVTMTSARARLLSADPLVMEVDEVPLSTPAQSMPAPSHLKPRPSGYGDNGQSGTYTYDGAGNITAIGADTYVYDTAQRLVSSVTRGVQENYTYDAYGNRTSATGAVNCVGQSNCAQTVTVDSNTNHLGTINGAAVTYDAAGNIQTIAAASGSPGATYSYDGTGMMTGATVGSDVRQFIYTADDERIAVKQGASWTWTIRDQSGKVLREFTSLESGSGPNLAMTDRHWAKDYIWRDGLLLATVSPSGTLHYHLDHLGTPRLITDANGVKVAEHAYYPFGAEINLTPHENPEEAMKFTGHERDLVVGDGRTLDYMHARFYNPVIGRFLSVDPELDLKKTPPSPQRWNRYSYVTNNPVGKLDPNGKADTDLTCVPADICNRPGAREAFRNGQTQALKLGLAIDAAIFGGAEVPSLARAGFSWALANPSQAMRLADAVLSPPGSSALPAASISGEVLREFSTSKGAVGILANASSEGTVLTLKDAAVYPMASAGLTNHVGPKQMLEALKQLGSEAKAAGYTQLVVEGTRVSGANPGKTARVVLDLTKLEK
jgi:RHS repeat-associated protein